MGKLVSIILPTYNGELYLPQLLDTLMSQTYKNIEVIIVDDNSKDNTLEIIHKYLEKDKRIKLFINKVNLGVNKNFEKGIRLAQGDCIFLCDQDDLWDGNKLEKMTHKIKQGYDLVYCDLRVIDSRNRVISQSFHKLIGNNNMPSPDKAKYLLFRNVTNGCSICFSKNIIDDIIPFPDYIIYDWWIMIKASILYKVGKINEQLMSYRIHDNNTLGFPTHPKDKKIIITDYQESIIRLNLLCAETDISKYKQEICILSNYYKIRLRYISDQGMTLKYWLNSLAVLRHFPIFYKYILKNTLNDIFPNLHKLAMKLWLKKNMKKYV
jgi:glycosyltransferase involved in cell wall biosynthesis